ncbi:MAG: DUF169 domain-containing protein [Methanobrevibacter sp.]|nr:DUF169 domain-containing protein [Methanobrevibacter sp.]
MKSKVADLLDCKFKPITIVKSNEKDKRAIGPKSDKSHCIMSYVARVIANRKIAIFEKDTVSCIGGLTGLGFGNAFMKDDETFENYSTFLSLGLKVAKDKEKYQEFCNYKPKPIKEMFENGERVYSNKKRAEEFLSNKVPSFNNKEKYVIFKPIEDVKDGETVESVIFTVNTFELACLMNFDASLRDDFGYLLTPPAAACQAMASFVFMESQKEDPHPVLGLLDFAGRKHMARWIPDDYLNISIPFKLFEKYENNCENSYLDGHVWNVNKNNYRVCYD